jgi:hypothetical protein
VKLTDEQALRQRLREEYRALEICPAPVLRVTGRGQGIRVRRRALTGGTVIAVALAVAAAAHFSPRPVTGPTVTLNAPNPAAPGGVFASGTAGGKRWTLAVRNIVAAPGTGRCLPAVMFSGHDGDVLFRVSPGTPSFGNPALLAGPPGFPGITAVFTQVAPDVTRLVAVFPGGRRLSVRPVWVSACAQRFHLAGFAYAKAAGDISELATYSRLGLGDGLVITPADLNPLTSPALTLLGPTSPGIWANLDDSQADVAASEAQSPIGAGNIGGQVWHIRTSLGLFGQCYTATLRGGPGRGRGQGSECVPVAAPPRAIGLAWVPVPGAATELSGYAGLVSPRTARVEVALSDGVIPPARPVTVAGRSYVAFVIPPGCRVLKLQLFDSAGHMFASTADVPPAK